MTKEDYMQLSKERLAELLVERDRESTVVIPYPQHTPQLQCYEPGGVCKNPQMDCINCPKRGYGAVDSWNTTIANMKDNL